MKKLLLLTKTFLVAALLGVGTSAWAQFTTWTFKDNVDVWGADGVTLKGGNQYDNTATTATSGGVTFTGTSGFVSTAKGIGFNATGSTSDENISIVVPAGYKATVSVYSNTNRTVVGKMGETTQTFASSWASATKEFDNSKGNSDVTLYLYCTQNPGGDAQNKAPFLESITLTDMTAVSSYSWTANAVATINNVKTTIKTYESASDVPEGSDYTVNVDKVIVYGGNYYELNDAAFTANVFRKIYTMGNATAVHEITYTKVDNAVFFGEAEDIYTAGSNASKSEQAVLSSGEGYSAMSSNGGYVTLGFEVPSDGVYNLILGANNTNGTNRGFNYQIDGGDASETITVNANTPHVQNINSQYLTAGDHTIRMNITYSLTPVFDYLLIVSNNEAANAIAECKTYETSAAFATHIDGLYAAGSLTTAADVYAAHTAWQIAQAKASGSTDYSKVILDYAVTTNNAKHFWGNLSDGSSSPYTGAPDNYYLTWTSGAEYSVWNGVYGLPAGKYTATTYTYSSIAGDRNQYIAILDPWTDVNTAAKGGSRETADDAGWVKVTSTFVLDATNNLAFGVFNPAVTGRVAGFDNWTLTKTAEYVTVSDAGYATYVPDYDLNFTDSEIKAYTVKVTAKGVATMTKVDNVPAGTPVLLYKEGGANEYIPVMTGAAAVSDNDLVAGTGAAVATTDGEGNTNMILNNVSGIGFYFANNQTVATNRAYLHFASNLAPDANTGSRMVMIFADDKATGISGATLNNNEEIIKGFFNLQGQRVNNPAKGLYIVDGRKVVIK